MARNPAWTRDELILALDLYLRLNAILRTRAVERRRAYCGVSIAAQRGPLSGSLGS
jgi:hypothetical protein